jgi:hypothetical protein
LAFSPKISAALPLFATQLATENAVDLRRGVAVQPGDCVRVSIECEGDRVMA